MMKMKKFFDGFFFVLGMRVGSYEIFRDIFNDWVIFVVNFDKYVIVFYYVMIGFVMKKI